MFGFSSRSLGYLMFCLVRDLPPAPASWAVPVNQNITWPRFLDEKPKRREDFQLLSKMS